MIDLEKFAEVSRELAIERGRSALMRMALPGVDWDGVDALEEPGLGFGLGWVHGEDRVLCVGVLGRGSPVAFEKAISEWYSIAGDGCPPLYQVAGGLALGEGWRLVGDRPVWLQGPETSPRGETESWVRYEIEKLRNPIGGPEWGLTESGRGRLEMAVEVARRLGLGEL